MHRSRMTTEDNCDVTRADYKEIRNKERDKLHLILSLEKLDQYYELFRSQKINYFKFMRMGDEDFKRAQVLDDGDREKMLEMTNPAAIKQHRNSCLSSEEGLAILKNMEDHLQLLLTRHDEAKATLVANPMILQCADEMTLRSLLVSIENVNVAGSEFRRAMLTFEKIIQQENSKDDSSNTINNKMNVFRSIANFGTGCSKIILSLSTFVGAVILLSLMKPKTTPAAHI